VCAVTDEDRVSSHCVLTACARGAIPFFISTAIGQWVAPLALLAGFGSFLSGAAFTANLMVSLIGFPAPIENQFGYAVINDPFLPAPAVFAVGNAAAWAAPATSVYNPVPGGPSLVFTCGPVGGVAGPGFGVAAALSRGRSHSINLANLTGSGPPTPPGVVLPVAFAGVYDFLLWTAVQGAMEDAFARVSFAIVNESQGGILFGPVTVEVQGNAMAAGTVAFGFVVALPAHSVTKIRIDPFAYGYATAAEEPPPPPPPPDLPPPPPIPEPATWGLTSIGILAVAVMVRLRRRMS